MEVIRSKLEPRVVKTCTDHLQLEQAIKRAFRRAVVAKCAHPCLDAIKTQLAEVTAVPFGLRR